MRLKTKHHVIEEAWLAPAGVMQRPQNLLYGCIAAPRLFLGAVRHEKAPAPDGFPPDRAVICLAQQCLYIHTVRDIVNTAEFGLYLALYPTYLEVF
jgi:hypothetical protein